MEKVVFILILILLVVVLIIGVLVKGERFQMRQENTGKIVNVKKGISFTYLFFGPFVPLCHGFISAFFLTLISTFISVGLLQPLIAVFYNTFRINWLEKKGYKRVEGTVQSMEKEDNLISPPRLDAIESVADENTKDYEYKGIPALEYEMNGYQSEKLIETNDNDKKFWLSGAPVLLDSVRLFENAITEELYLRLEIQNLSSDSIAAVYMDIKCFDILKNEVLDLKDVHFLDMNLKKGKKFCSNNQIHLDDRQIRKCEVTIRHVVFSNEEIWNYDGEAVFTALPYRKEIDLAPELIDVYRQEVKAYTDWKPYDYEPEVIGEGWYCGCGQFNRNHEIICCSCGISKDKAFELADREFLKHQYEVRLIEKKKEEEEKELRRKEQEAEEERKRKEKIEEWYIRIDKIEKKGKKLVDMLMEQGRKLFKMHG